MKKLFFSAVLVLTLLGCSSDSTENSTSNVDGIGGSLAIFALKGNYLYTVDHQKLNIFSLIDQNHPAKVNEINVGWDIETLFSFEDNLYIGSKEGMYIYSIVQPENPQYLSSAQHLRSCDPVVANQTHSFVTLHSTSRCGGSLNVLQVYDTQDPSSPTLIHQRNLVSPRGLALYHNFLIVCDDEIKIFDVSNPAEPVLATSIQKNCFDVIVKENTLYAIGDGSLARYELNPDMISNVSLQSEITF
ncbi:LVIVD repeat-containing protein [Flavobacterium silvaticum]|uniref:LVIVD repeat-containing protein n=1 Tax=Flavobacterium silvaticum TaxID=1852020 RepID=A0A972FR09_9FLAO|nr:hypothetical protein [Flavobacterium silvaticum]NMH27784.1 hypothetical protein [Flavobacterium silvaticum]